MASVVDAIKASSSAVGVSSKSSNIVSKDDFFKMLIAQLKNQDPMKPLDATAFTAQLAEFSSLEKMENMNSSLEKLLGQQDLFNRMGSAQLAGKYVVATGKEADSFTTAGGPVELGYRLPADAKQVLITVYDELGRVVDVIEKTAQPAGLNRAVWSNRSARRGNFTYQVGAFDGRGNVVGATTLIEGTVSKVSFHDGQVYVTVNNKEVEVGQLLSITDSKS